MKKSDYASVNESELTWYYLYTPQTEDFLLSIKITSHERLRRTQNLSGLEKEFDELYKKISADFKPAELEDLAKILNESEDAYKLLREIEEVKQARECADIAKIAEVVRYERTRDSGVLRKSGYRYLID